MVNQLKGLVSNKAKKPIIINGKLLTVNKSIVGIKRDNQKVILSYIPVGGKEIIIDDGDELLNKVADEFNEKFVSILGKRDNNVKSFYSGVDSFTGAIVLKNNLYDYLLDKNDEYHFHDGSLQFTSDVQKLITDFVQDFILNYFEIYMCLLDRRLMGSHMPVRIKSHLVKGLFQPIIVGTGMIDCPIKMSRFNWFHEYLDSDIFAEKILEHPSDTNRGLDLSVVAMCDFAEKFQVPCIHELNRVYFLIILYMLLMDKVEPGSASKMASRFNKVYSALENASTSNMNVFEFFLSCIKSFKQQRTALVVR